ncbi:MAG: 6-carboxytetrahydropterin synthase QueD [Bacteroidales bacterium]|nr:6-carboxytetrahydropterin synthase QueD [Bacteroidales bacterium]
MKMLLTKKFTFEMAHALDGYEGKCANLHGHSYHLEVTIEGTVQNSSGMTMDFGSIKKLVQSAIVDKFDHALVLKKGSELALNQMTFQNLVEVPFNPTTENLLIHFATILEPLIPAGTHLYSLRLAETDTSVAELQL